MKIQFYRIFCLVAVLLQLGISQATTHTLRLKAQPDIACTFNTDSASLEAGATISLSAYTQTGFKFLRWEDEAGALVSNSGYFQFTMPEGDALLYAVCEYNPENPANPAINYWNKESGEVIVDDFTPGNLSGAISTALAGSSRDDVNMITVSGMINNNDLGIINNYKNCYLLDLSRVSGITEIPSYAFDYTNLESVYLPAMIEKIGARAFYDCKKLTSLTVYAMVSPTLESDVFSGVQDGLIIYVPAAAIARYQEAEVWKDFIILPIQEDIRSISVSLPEGTNVADYAQMWLELTNTKSGQHVHYVMTDRSSYTFANIIRNTSWNAVLRNQRGDVFGKIDNIEVKDEDVNVTFKSLSKPQRVSLSVKTPEGDNVTAKTQVTWVDSDGNYLAQSTGLSGLIAGYAVSYRVVLSQELAMLYVAPEQKSHIVSDANNNLTLTLEPIKQVTLSGCVKDMATRSVLNGATVTASQTYGGKYSKTVSTKTDSKGNYTLNVSSLPTSLSVSASDYISQTIVCDSLMTRDESVTLSDISLKGISGAVVSLNLTYTKCPTEDGDEDTFQEWYADYNNVAYSIYNKTKQKGINQFNVQYPQIVLLEEVDEGDVLEMTATSKVNAFMPVKASATIDAEQRANAAFNIVELGKVKSVFAKNSNASVVGSLYDSNGKLVKSYDYSNASLTINDLVDGSYTLVTMGASKLFNSIYDLSQLPQTGLVLGSDYTQATVEVQSGKVCAIDIAEVPTLDESKLYYTGDNTSFTVNKSSIVAGNYLTLTGHLDFKSAYAGNVSNVNLIVDLPESCEFVENSVMVGNSTSSYTIQNNRITIPMARYTDRVRFCIIPTFGGEYAPSALAQFDIDGETITQPIGSANYTAKDLSISVPSTVAKTTIPISGTAIGASTIEVYDGDVLIGQTTSLANGIWSTTCELNDAYNLSTHNIYAKVTTKNGLQLISENVSCIYDMNAIQVSKVIMYHDNPEMHKTYELTFDFLNPSDIEENYIYYIYNKKFTFTIDFTNNDTTKVSDVVLYVKTAKSGWHPLNANYDSKIGMWFVTSEFGDMYDGDLPVNVSVDYYVNREIHADASKVNDIINNCDIEFTDDPMFLALLENCDAENFSETSLKNLFDYLEISSISTSIPEDLQVFLDDLDSMIDTNVIRSNVDEFCYNDFAGNIFFLKNQIVDDYESISDIIENAYSLPLNDSTSVKISIQDNSICVLWNDRLLSFQYNEGAVNQNRMLKSASADEFFNKWNQYKTVLEGLQNIPKIKQCIEKLKSFFLQGLTRRENDLSICRDIKLAYARDQLSPKQLEELDLRKLEDSLNRLPKEIKQIKDCLGRLKSLFKFIEIASIINDINVAIESREEWNSIIKSIEGLNCPGMDALAAKARNYRDWVAAGYNANISANVSACIGLDKVLAFLVVAGVEAGVGAELSMATLSLWCDIIVAAVKDIVLIQGGWNQINDINWKSEIRLKIPTTKAQCPDPPGGGSGGPTGGAAPLPNGGGQQSGNKDKKFGIDPSGFVYEGVFSNRLEGVTATAYYKENVEDMYGDIHENIVKWDAAEYAQENPLFTDENGYYRWDVPQGMWQVKFEKEGYETTYSDWLPVPPPQLDVNISMKQNVQPNVKNARAYEDAVEVKFDKYMMPELLNTDNIIVMAGGKQVEGFVQLLNEEVKYEGESETFASKVRFNANAPFEGTEITLMVNNRVKSYAGIRMQDNYSQSFTIEQEIRKIVCDSATVVGYGRSGIIPVTVLPASASAGKTINVRSSSQMILATDVTSVVLDANGKADIPVSGELPGTAALTFTIDGYDLSATSIVNVQQIDYTEIAAPTANVASGTTVEKGTKIILSCTTEGATIYYTLDGSCPCDEATRLVYTEPIVINETVTIKAMAVAQDMTESDIVEFTYIVDVTDGIDDVTIDENLKIYPLPVRDKLNITAGGKIIKSATLVSMSGSTVVSASKPVTHVTIDVSNLTSGIYIINVATEDKTYSRKIMKVE